jgi:diguanylate cyclase (GGDEF)-like protein
VAVVIAITAAVVLAASHPALLQSVWQSKHENIRDLPELPSGPVHLEGVVTYVDSVGKRFWIQDETGAIAINQDPALVGVRFRQLLRVQANKAHSYAPRLGFASVDLTQFRIAILKDRTELPIPAPATVRTLPEKEKNGIRVSVEGILRDVVRQDNGLTELAFGESGQELRAVVVTSRGDLSSWINATVRITGVCETELDAGGIVRSQYIWVGDISDIQKIDNPPLSVPLYSVRGLYRAFSDKDGHRVRLRGTVRLQEENFLLVEDKWGAVGVRLDKTPSLSPGTAVEVAGFPFSDGLRIDLSHPTVTPIGRLEMEVGSEPKLFQLTTVAAVRKLTETEAAAALPVKVTGVVTYVDSDWRQLFLQDATGGIFVKYAGSPTALVPGQKISVLGLSHPGDYAPVIIAPKILVLGKGQLPRPILMTARAFTGILDSRFVEAEGVIHSLKTGQSPKHQIVDLYSSVGPIGVTISPDFSGVNYIRTLEDATVRIRGVCAERLNSRRQLIGLQLELSSADNIDVLEAGNPHPFDSPATPVNQLLRYSPAGRYDHRIKVRGSVTMLGNGFFYLQDRTGGLRIEADTRDLHLADLVDAVGYASPGGYSPILTDAVVKVLQHNVPVAVRKVTAESMTGGQFDSQLVSIEGTLLSVVKSVDSKTLVLRSGGRTLDAVLYILDSGEPVPELREGSVLRLVGICSADVTSRTAYMLVSKDAVKLKLVIRSPRDIEILRLSSWWDERHTILALSALSLALLASVVWLTSLRRRVRRQTEALEQAQEKADAIHQLTDAMQEVTKLKQFTSRVSVQGQDEISQLGVEFNNMITELQRSDLAKSEAESKLQWQALTDELTGLPNRRLLHDRLTQVLALAKRESHIVALLYLDLDGFKLINDSLGHTVGDLLLGQVAKRLQSRIRKADTLARLGGDEFTVILSSLRSKEEAELVANSLLGVLAIPFAIESHELTIGASIGISVFPDNASEASDLLQQADSAMYSAKRDGKNRVAYFTSRLGSLVRERLSLENQLRAAISRGEIDVHYQPEFEVSTQRLVRFEALARWHHPTLGNISPSKFIPIAEESGLIIPLGMFILERACEQAVTWQSVSTAPVQVAVNVSSIQFMRETFVDEVAEVLRHTTLDPKLLQIELTESVMLHGADPAAETMQRLKALGVSIAIDDFGTGYSCFSYLPRLPFNALKIDRAFVMDLDKRPEMLAMVQSLVTLAHNLNMQVVAEGVETVRQLEMIEMLGGNQVQGYLLGRPTADPKSQLLVANGSMQCGPRMPVTPNEPKSEPR